MDHVRCTALLPISTHQGNVELHDRLSAARLLAEPGAFLGAAPATGSVSAPRTSDSPSNFHDTRFLILGGGGGGGGAAAGLVRGMRFFDDAAELEALLAQAGFAPEGVQVRREGRGCAVVRAEKAAEGVV